MKLPSFPLLQTFLWSGFWPHKNFTYYKRYPQVVSEISTGQHHGSLRMAQIVLLSTSTLFLIHFFSPQEPRLQLILFNYTYILGLIPFTSIIGGSYLTLAAYLIYEVYHPEGVVVQTLQWVLLGHGSASDILRLSRYHNQPAVGYLRSFAIKLIALNGLFIILANVSLILAYLVGLFQVHRLGVLWIFPLHSLFFMWQVCGAWLFIHVISLCGTTQLIFFKTIVITLWQNNHRIHRAHRPGAILRFMALQKRALVVVLRTGRVLGRLLFVFLVVNCPTNSIISILLFRSKDPRVHLILGSLFTYQQLAIVGFHLYIAHGNDKLIQPNRRLLHLAAQPNTKLRGRSRLQLSLYIQAIHTKKRYGITYYKFGLISMMSFAKYILLYIEMLMYSYQLITYKLH